MISAKLSIMGATFGSTRAVGEVVAEAVSEDSTPSVEIDDLSSTGATCGEGTYGAWHVARMYDAVNYVHRTHPENMHLYDGSGELCLMNSQIP